MDIANKIRLEVEKSDLSQAKVAAKLGCSPQYLSNVINGKNPPNIEFIANFSKFFNVNINWLVLDEGSKEKKEQSDSSLEEIQRLRDVNTQLSYELLTLYRERDRSIRTTV